MPTNAEILLDLAERLGEQRIADLIRREVATNVAPSSTAPPRKSGRYLTVEQVAEQLDVCTKTVYQMLKDQRLAYMRPTKRRGGYRISPASLEQCLRNSEVLPVGVRRGEVAR